MIAVDRRVLVRAPRVVVFAFLSDPRRFASWFGTGSTIDPRIGGAVRVSFPGGASAVGEVVTYEQPAMIAFTWGYPGDDSPLAIGASTVTITLEEHPAGTMVHLTHELPSDDLRDAHVAGWRHHLSHLAALAADERRDVLERAVAAWTRLWDRDEEDPGAIADAALSPDVEVLDTLATLAGRQDVVGHVANAHRHLPGVTWAASDDLRTVGDRATWSWRMIHDDHGVVGSGRSSLRVDPDGRIAEVVGWWDDHPDDVSRRAHGMAAEGDDPPAA